MDTHAAQRPCFPYGRGRNKTARQTVVCEKLRDAGRIDLVGLMPGQSAHLRRVHQRQVKSVAGWLQYVPYRNPVHPGRFRRNLPELVFVRPVGQSFQIGGKGAERFFLLFVFTAGHPDADAGDHVSR